MGWPPQTGELLPRADEATGVGYKLRSYSLNPAHRFGGPKAKGFALILGITIDSVDYLEEQILLGVLLHPVKTVIDNRPYGFNCVVEFPIQGIGSYSDRAANLRTIWELADQFRPPRMVNAFLKV